MPFYRVLEDEFDKLHANDQRETGAVRTARVRSWLFTPAQILDPRDLARRLDAVRTITDATNSEDVATTVLGDDARLAQTLNAYLEAGRPLNDPTAIDFKNALSARLNELLTKRDLREARTVKALALSPYATALRDNKIDEMGGVVSSARTSTDIAADKTNEANRLFLEAAFPTQLQRIRDIRLGDSYAQIRSQHHSALALSGGGIRSATFALGVAQALASKSILTKFNYISTVSGGGFLGGWLSAWMQHTSPEYVQDELRKTPAAKLDPEPVPVKHLRNFTNYMSPKLGLLSADAWTLVATYIRNVLLNWLVIVPLIAMAVLVPWGAIAVMNSKPSEWWAFGNTITVFGFDTQPLIALMYLSGLLSGAYAVRYVHSDDPDARRESNRKGPTQGKTQKAFLLRCLLPLVLSAIFLTTAWYLSWQWNFEGMGRTPQNTLIFFTGFGVLLHLLGWLFSGPFDRPHWFLDFLLIVFSGGIIGALSSVIAHGLVVKNPDVYVTTAMPLFLLLLMLSGQIYLGVASRRSKDSDREWGARFNAWIFIVVVSWAAICAIIVYGPELFSAGYRALVGISAGGISGIVTLMIGGSAKTDGKSESSAVGSAVAATKSLSKQLASIALGLAAPVFAIALIILISTLDLWFINKTCFIETACRLNYTTSSMFQTANDVHALTVLLLMVALVGVGYFFGYFIDTNDFSLHAMYRARLIRAYLGGSRPAGERRPDHFTGFDEKDDVLMRDLWPAKGASCQPLHVVNVTLNLVAGEKLAWQERKAESLTMSSLHAGSAYLGYRRTSDDSDDTSNLYANGTLSLGTAIAISGAAASPSMGYHSSAAVTFLMTLFNARMGGWFGNTGPAGGNSFNLEHPRMSVWPILSELFGLSDDRSQYVYLSDGGHFENIALYEMVMRRCRFVIVSDASCDEDCSYNDLGNAIRKIRIDMGVPIEFDGPMQIAARTPHPQPDKRAWAIGRIRYSCVDRPNVTDGQVELNDEDIDGVLLYIKPSFYGVNEPPDVYNYAKSAPAFPHESTADQFFSESQFESYRALGMHIVNELWNDDLVKKELIRAGFIAS